jgi:lipoprotein-releasing system permease protein
LQSNEILSLNTELFISRRIRRGDRSNFSRPVVRISILGIALGLTVMFVAIAILTGFQRQIRDKITGFSGHIQITRYDENSSYEPQPIARNQPFLQTFSKTPGIRHIQVFATKAGIIKTQDQIEGVLLKGIDRDFDWSFFGDRIVEGKPLIISDTGKTNDVIVSRALASLLKLKLNDDIRMYFISGSTTLGRKFHISGIYETGLDEFDKLYILCDIRHIIRLNNWEPDQVGGFEVLVNNFNDMDRIGKYIYERIGFSLDARTIKQIYPNIFDWLGLQDINVLIILALMVLVAGITIISTLLILILERTRMIGILKALGMRNGSIRKIFVYNAAYITGLGLLWGNIFGFGLCLLQMKFGFIHLDQASYYVSKVPVDLNLVNILLLNAGTFLLCYLMLLIPSYVVTKITPLKAIRFS